MRKLAMACAAALAALAIAGPAVATVVPPTPEQIAMMQKRQALENRARAAFGDIGLIEKLRDWRQNWGWILVGKDGSSAAPRLLIKDEYGWYEMRPGQTRRLPADVGLELNRLVHQGELWDEDAYNFKSKCTGTPRLFVIMHAGNDQFGRIGCGPEGLAARVARTAEALRALPGSARTTAQRREERATPRGASPAYMEASRQASGQLFDMAAAWERRSLPGFVEAYASNAVIEAPFGILRGRKSVVDYVRSLQDWNAPYAEAGKRLRVERIVSDNQEAKDVFYTKHELRWQEGGTETRQTFSTMWRNHNGLWLIAHEKMSELKPVTGERVPW